MIKKGTKLYSIIKGKCPYCHNGQFFISHAYNLRKMGDVYHDCSVCNNTFIPETGFYFGAMYVSYAIGVALLLNIVLALNLLNIELEIIEKISLISAIWLLLTPKIHSLSKIIWANIYMQYKK